jgi:tRNA(Ile2) C34 agmatinyltransferase TiaS
MNKIHITEEQLKNIVEIVTKTRVICDKCEWSCKLSDGGDDPYICHKCGHNNEEKLKK